MLVRAGLCVAWAASTAAAGLMNLTVALASMKETSILASSIAGNAALAVSLSTTPDITFFAPSDEAITRINASLPDLTKKILSDSDLLTAYIHYHVIPGVQRSANFSTTPSFPHTLLDDTKYSNVTGGQAVEITITEYNQIQVSTGFKNVANAVQPDIAFSGGVIHIIDSIFSIPEDLPSTAQASGLTAFLGALLRCGLLEALDDTKDLTIFAPTNAAFEAIGSAFTNISQPDLAKILAYHVVKGSTTYSTGFHDNTKSATIPGQEVTFSVAADALFVNQARVVNADIFFSNGVIHIIDSVLNPNNTDVKPSPADNKPGNAFNGTKPGPITNLTRGFSPNDVTLPGLTLTVPNVLAVASVLPAYNRTAESAAVSMMKMSSASMMSAIGTMLAMSAYMLYI